MNFVHCSSFIYYIVRSEQWVRLRVLSKFDTCVYSNTSMASSEVNVENTNASDEITDLDSSTTVNPLVLLVRIEHVDGRPIESEILTETSFRELCAHTNPVHIPNTVEILSPYELCLTYGKGTVLGQVAGELMALNRGWIFPSSSR